MGYKNMSSENNVYRMGTNNMSNIHKKLHNACNHAKSVQKANKVKGMPFNPLLHDDVQRVAMDALLLLRVPGNHTCPF